MPGLTKAEAPVAPVTIELSADYPDRVAGVVYGLDTVVARLQEVGCAVRSTPASHEPTIAPWRAQPPDGADHHAKHDRQHTVLLVTPPSWRPDLTDPADLAEEVIRLEGYSNVPVRQPRATAGRGLTSRQQALRAVARTLADDGFVEVHSEPFGPASDADRLMLPADDPRRAAVAVANPLSDDQPLLRTTLLPGLLRRPRAERRPRLRRHRAVRVRPGLPAPAGRARSRADPRHRPGADRGGAGDDRRGAAGAAAADRRGAGRVPRAARPVGSRTGRDLGRRDRGGPLGGRRGARRRSTSGRRRSRRSTRAGARRSSSARCDQADTDEAALEWLAGYAGELHPRVVAAFGLPERTCAFELDLAVIAAAAEAAGPVRGPALSAYPLATQDIALVVAADVPAADVAAALTAGAGELLEDVRLFDVYTGAQLGAGNKSLAYTLRLRAPDRTLTAAEATAARDAAVAEAARRTGAVLRA